MVVPHDKDIYDFCPIQRPADDTESSTITTHFDYHAISGKLLKLDILGHDDPTMLKMLYDLTGVNPIEIPLDDKQTKSLFLSNESLNLKGDIGTTLGTYGIPEFGTKFVMEMLIATKPNEFADLVRISGLSHGTDVWLNNANDYIKNGKATIKEVIATRDDIMVYLMHKGLDASDAFSIMEKVRKGKGLSDEHEEKMIQNNVPKWYIESCKKIKYMFPKAHAVAYVIMAFRVAYYKVHYPLAYYAAYFTIRASEFDANLVIQGPKKIKEYIENIQLLGKNATAKDKSMVTVLEIALEMLYRDYEFSKVDLYKSHYSDFLIENGKLLLPLNSLEGVGESAAIKIYEEAKKNTFLSVEDMQKRTKASKTVTEVMKQHGCFASIPQSNQLSFF
jgi:DNA polymerase-3 subunit alpha (Gram-positive type)